MLRFPLVLAALAAASPPAVAPAAPGTGARGATVPGTALWLGMPIARLDSLPAFRRTAAAPNRRSGSIRFFGLPCEAVIESELDHVTRATFTVAEASAHSRDYVEDQLRRMGMRRECAQLDSQGHDCRWIGRVAMHLSWRTGVLISEVEPAPEPAPPIESAATERGESGRLPDRGDSILGEAPMLPETLSFSARPAPGRRPELREPMPVPAFPPAARRAGVQGVVRVLATVDTTGAVVETTLLRGIPELDEAAIEAARLCRFVPLELDGRPVRFHVVIPFTFTAH